MSIQCSFGSIHVNISVSGAGCGIMTVGFNMSVFRRRDCSEYAKDRAKQIIVTEREKKMKKKLVTAILAVVMTTSLLTACGGDKGAAKSSSTSKTEAQAPAADTKSDAPAADTKADAGTDAAAGDMVSDEDFAILQENYELIQNYAEQVKELYSSDEIAANPEIEDLLVQGDDVMAQIAAITQDQLSAADAAELNETMKGILEAYVEIVGNMEEVDNNADAGAAAGEMVSDETFAALGQAYDSLTELYNTVAQAYNDSGAEDADIKAAMDEAYEYLTQMGEITQDSITEEDAQALAESMLTAIEVLSAIAESL